MKYYLGDKFLFIDMNQHYTHCVVEGEDRVISCLKSPSEASRLCRDIREQKYERISDMQRLLDGGHEYTAAKKTAYGIDPRELYPTAGLLHGAMMRMKRNAESVRVMELTAVE